MKLVGYTPVKDRELFLRTCLLQSISQTRPLDEHLVLINGENAERYDTRLIDDLIRPGYRLLVSPGDQNIAALTLELFTHCLEGDGDVFFKFDSDDIYMIRYVEFMEAWIKEFIDKPTEKPFCINLVNQLFIKSQGPQSEVSIQKYGFDNGLGLTEDEVERGITQGMSQTIVLNRAAVEIIVNNTKPSQCHLYHYDDIMIRSVLADHGVFIQKVPTRSPLAGYLVHDNNTST